MCSAPVGPVQVHPQTVHDVGHSQSRGAGDSSSTVDQDGGSGGQSCICDTHRQTKIHTTSGKHAPTEPE